MAPPETHQAGESEIETMRYVYSDGQQRWTTTHPIVAGFFPLLGAFGQPATGWFRLESSQSSAGITALGEDATPQLLWD